MNDKIDLFVLGLGNPDSNYLNTRHNIGWSCVEKLIEQYEGKINTIRNSAKYSILKIKNKNVLAAMPLTYMNASGIAAKKLCNMFQIPCEKLLIVVDEYNFPVGKIHIKSSGSDGGHNGVASIIEELGTNNFYRLRCGIDRNFTYGGLIDYVLSDFSNEEKENVNKMIDNVVKAINHFTLFEPGRAMSDINSGKIFQDESNMNSKKE